jgi:hypothetical protein
MLQGDFAAAWQISDAVLRTRDRRLRDDPAQPYHLRWVWDGSAFDGRDVLVRCYHGLGDTLQFARFLPLLARQASSVRVETPAPLIDVLCQAMPGCDCVPFEPARPLPPADCDIEIMELAHALRITDVSVNADYLAPPVPRSDAAAPPPRPLQNGEGSGARRTTPPPLVGGGRGEGERRIGLCWAAGDWDPSRSVPPGAMFDALAGAGATLISLQRGPQAALPPTLAKRLANPNDFSMQVSQAISLIRTLDLVVSVDSFVAHLAGAMGKSTCVLLKQQADWRWMSGSACAWYPRAVLFRQHKEGQWADALDALAGALKDDPCPQKRKLV